MAVAVDIATRDCRTPHCTGVATGTQGIGVYCAACIRARRGNASTVAALASRSVGAKPASAQDAAGKLTSAARRLDRARAKAEGAARELQAAKMAWAEALESANQLVRPAGGGA